MKIEDLETADCQVDKSEIEDGIITFFFDQVYDLKAKEYVKNVSFVIKEWTNFLAKIYISESPFSKPIEHELATEDIQKFDLIQELIISNNHLKLGGYSRDSRHWLVYEFTDYKYELINNSSI